MSNGKLSRVIMVQGTSSHAGKSVFAAALCRIFARAGYSVAPFKAQNMSLNSFATPDGGEIGRSQAVQAAAAMTTPRVEMNPVLLKPESDNLSQVVVLGRPQRALAARDYYDRKEELWRTVTASLDALRREFDVVVIEGAGSPAEINLRHVDIVNMAVARYSNSPVLLVGDIERGGAFAQLVGTMALLEPEERELVKGFVINKFRGDSSLLAPGLDVLRERTGVSVAGVLPYYFDIHIPEEDTLGLPEGTAREESLDIDVTVLRLPHIANFDDFDPLHREPGVRVHYVTRAEEFGEPDLVVIPGSKTTAADLDWLRERGLAGLLLAARARGTPIIGICAGYQMLGMELLDPDSVESPRLRTPGLGLLPCSTTFLTEKATHQVRARVTEDHGLLSGCSGAELTGYEIHMGVTSGAGLTYPFVLETRSGERVNQPDGALDAEGLTLGTYMHGLFNNRAARQSILACVANRKGITFTLQSTDAGQDEEYDKLAAFVCEHVDMDLVYRSAGLRGK